MTGRATPPPPSGAQLFPLWNDRGLPILLAIPGLVLVGQVVLYLSTGWMVDDAYITFRYVLNLWDGHGLVFNPGELVEGYSNFLWLLVLSLLGRLGIGLPTLSIILGSVFAYGAVLAAMTMTRRMTEDRAAVLVAGLLAAGFAPLAVWTVGGLETTMYVFLFLLGFDRFLVEGESESALPLSAVMLALAALTRIDGLVWGAAVGVLYAWRLRAQPRRVLAWWMVYAVLLAPMFVWRLAYYGEWMPNTVFAKVDPGRDSLLQGAEYLFVFARDFAPYIVLAIIGVIAARRVNRSWYLVGLFAAAAYFSVLGLGADPLPGYRFFIVPTLLLVPFAAISVASASSVRRHALLVAAIAAVGLSVSTFAWQKYIDRAIAIDDVVREGTRAGRHLHDNLPAGTWIAVNCVGALPYYSGLPTIDMLGLCDHHIARLPSVYERDLAFAHRRGDGPYVLRRNPGLILFAGPKGHFIPMLPSDMELADLDDFWLRYRPCMTTVTGTKFRFFLRNDLPAWGGVQEYRPEEIIARYYPDWFQRRRLDDKGNLRILRP